MSRFYSGGAGGERELPLAISEKIGNIIYNYPYEIPLRLGEFQDVSQMVYVRDVNNQPASYFKATTTVTILLKKTSV